MPANSKEKNLENVRKAQEKNRSLGLISKTVWIPPECTNDLDLHARTMRIKFNRMLPKDETELFQTPEQLQPEKTRATPKDDSTGLILIALKAELEETRKRAHATSPRWAEAQKLMARIDAILQDI